MITLIHGPAELLRAEALADLRAQSAGDPTLAELNTTVLDGRQASLADLQNASDTLPFLSEHRLVIVEGFLRKLTPSAKHRSQAGEGEGEAADFMAGAPVSGDSTPEVSRGSTPYLKTQGKTLLTYLDHVPESTELVFVEEDTIGGGVILRRLMELQHDGHARVILCQKLRKNDLPDWIRARAKLRKVKLDSGAVADLTEFVGDDLRQMDQELIKLADFSAGRQTITRADVRRLVPATRAASVFDLVDALGSGDAATAGRLMQHALDVDAEQPLRLLGMIARQYRLLIQAKALQAQGEKPPDIARALNIPEWNAPRLLVQAGRHTFARLERAMERIAAADEGIKTGKWSDREAMDLLLAELQESTR